MARQEGAMPIDFTPPTSTPFGTIWYGVVAAAVFAVLAWFLRRPLYGRMVPLLRAIGRWLPTPARAVARRALDWASPSWRELADEQRPELLWRLGEVRSTKHPAFVIV